MLTLIAIVGRREGVDLTGLHFRLEKHMQSDPRRVGAVPATIWMPAGLTLDQRAKLERAALTCPVHKSLPPELEREVRFVYPEEAAVEREPVAERAARA
jgi:hypothetical protein